MLQDIWELQFFIVLEPIQNFLFFQYQDAFASGELQPGLNVQLPKEPKVYINNVVSSLFAVSK